MYQEMDLFDPYDYASSDSDYDDSSDSASSNSDYDLDTRAIFCNRDVIDDTDDSCDFAYSTDWDESDDDVSNDYNFTHEPEDYYPPQKSDTPHGKTEKDQKRREQKMESTKFVKSLNSKDFNTWQKNKKNKSRKANQKWNHSEVSQII
jgi:hypothetical protein